MKRFIKNNPGLAAVFFIFSAAGAVLMAAYRLLPFIDLPNHLAVATICRYFGQPDNLFAQYFDVDLWLNSNVAHVLFFSWQAFPSVEFANHVYFAVYAVLLPLSVLLLIRKLGGNLWLALPAFLLINNYNLMWGFAGYAMAVPLLMFLVHLTISCLPRRSWLSRIGVAALVVLLFFVHAQVAAFAIVLFCLCAVYHHRTNFRTLVIELLAIVPATVILLVWWTSLESQPDTLPFLSYYYGGRFWETLYLRWEVVMLDNSFLYARPAGTYVATGFGLVMLIPMVWGLITKSDLRREILKRPEVAPVWILTGLSLVLFLLLPDMLPGQPYLYQRFSVLVMLGVIIIGSLFYKNALPRISKVVLAVLPVLYFALWFQYYDDFNRQNESLTRYIFPTEASTAKVAGLVYDYEFRGQATHIHLPYYYTVWNRGITPGSYVDYRFGIVRRKVSEDILPRYDEWEGLLGRYDGRYNDLGYLLVRGDVPPHIIPRLGQLRLVRDAGIWSLYRNEG